MTKNKKIIIGTIAVVLALGLFIGIGYLTHNDYVSNSLSTEALIEALKKEYPQSHYEKEENPNIEGDFFEKVYIEENNEGEYLSLGTQEDGKIVTSMFIDDITSKDVFKNILNIIMGVADKNWSPPDASYFASYLSDTPSYSSGDKIYFTKDIMMDIGENSFGTTEGESYFFISFG